MLHRARPEGTLVIGQPMHARLTGMIARAWGNPSFSLPPCPPEIFLAADQHEIGMLPWEVAPMLNPATGLPHAYVELSWRDHLAMWRDAGHLLVPQSRYAALLTSRHGTWIFSQYEQPPADREERAMLADYLRHERAFQRRMRASLAADPAAAPFVTPAALTRAHRLFQVWDRIAVHLCYGEPITYHWERVSTAEGDQVLTLSSVGPDRWTLDPWPLAVPELHLIGEGRLVRERFTDRGAMREAFAMAEWVRWESAIVPCAER